MVYYTSIFDIHSSVNNRGAANEDTQASMIELGVLNQQRPQV